MRNQNLALGSSTGTYGCPGNWDRFLSLDLQQGVTFLSTLCQKRQSSSCNHHPGLGSILIVSATSGNIKSFEGNISWLRAYAGKKNYLSCAWL
jgi:hypothetical protein